MKTITVLVAAVALITTASAAEVSCNAGFILIGGTTCIKVFTSPVTWEKARDACADIENYVTDNTPHLARIDDCSLMSSLWAYVYHQLGLSEYLWLDGSDAAVEGEWVWGNGDAVPVGIPFWYPGQPDGGTLENRMVFAFNGFFADGHAEESYGYICQYSP